MSMVLDKGVLSQGFGEQISNLIIGAGKFWSLSDMFTKMMITHLYALCKGRALRAIQFLKHTDDLEVMIPDLCYQVHDGDHIPYRERHSKVLRFSGRKWACVCCLESWRNRAIGIEDGPTIPWLGSAGIRRCKSFIPVSTKICINIGFKTFCLARSKLNPLMMSLQ